ncbi:MAG: mechanosensitive ion channel [Chlorobium sp.]|uniref:mechanosensitive ion channel family protein n=1 Tax=Chlorobium sp. TaxID=1095 RepID=UPI001D38D254|nr:mechanosensitive ion channel domain-containing protein [Chlorobium sp.]MBN1279845.1 mechanosensitive ion channel [Chlorobiaceae bacterium]MCF8216919.1 mechanosensitive ion channel [Chlorobium sp.]MCF8271755.1 mechanosensitive ion channel [Chlorobium sp.]MCF8288136.1 mechanosensitive ion channel [Chlorobium sp.]MCF8291734.1 mechanosensitive ion channel [Chlorobium sp.]
MDSLQEQVHRILTILLSPVLSIGKSSISFWSIVVIVVSVAIIVAGAKYLKRFVAGTLLVQTVQDEGTRVALGTILQYTVVFFGFLLVLQSAGIDLSALAVLSGTIGLGIGFGLQNISNNFFSGLIILFERPVKVGDRIQVGDISGDVIGIAIRSTTIRTNDNITIIIPNSEFVSSQVINWSHSDRNVRITVPVGVSYNSDPQHVRDILLSVADNHPAILTEPKPDVIFSEFGDSALNFELRVWTKTHIQIPRILRSEVNYRIFDAFKKNGIEIPYPQRDLHIRSGNVVSSKTEEQPLS